MNAYHSRAIVGKDTHAQTACHHVFVYLTPTFDRALAKHLATHIADYVWLTQVRGAVEE